MFVYCEEVTVCCHWFPFTVHFVHHIFVVLNLESLREGVKEEPFEDEGNTW